MSGHVCSLLILLFILPELSHAQSHFLFFGGYNNTDFLSTESKSQNGKAYGIGLNFKLSEKLNLELDVLKSQRSAIIEDKIIGGWPVTKIELWDLYCSIKYTHIPILLKYNLYQKSKFTAQLYAGFGLDFANRDKSYRFNERYVGDVGDDVRWENTDYDYEYVYESSMLGVLASSGSSLLTGIRLQYAFLFCDIRYMNGPGSVFEVSGSTKSSRGHGNLYKLGEKMQSVYLLVGFQTKINWEKKR